jgi:hypothetical protein
MQQIIVIPHQTQRDCIVVEGKKYCQDENLTPNEFGSMLLFFGFATSYIILLFWLADKLDDMRIVVGGFVTPLFLFGVYFWLK